MTYKEYDNAERQIREFCIKNSLTHEISCGWREIDFVMEYHEEAIDTKTLENPTCFPRSASVRRMKKSASTTTSLDGFATSPRQTTSSVQRTELSER